MEVGNGESTTFWRDVWIKDNPLAQLFPSVYEVAEHRDISVKEARTGNYEKSVWHLNLKRKLYDWEVEEWMTLLELLYEWEGTREGEDQPRWRRAKSGNFSIKDNYSRLAEATQTDNMSQGPWKGVWKTGCPQR